TRDQGVVMRRQLLPSCGCHEGRPEGQRARRLVASLVGLLVLVGLSATATASPPPDSSAFSRDAGGGGPCSSMIPYVHGQFPPPGLNDLLPASTNRDTPNIVRIDVSNLCSEPFLIFFINASGTMIAGYVAPQTLQFDASRPDTRRSVAVRRRKHWRGKLHKRRRDNMRRLPDRFRRHVRGRDPSTALLVR